MTMPITSRLFFFVIQFALQNEKKVTRPQCMNFMKQYSIDSRNLMMCIIRPFISLLFAAGLQHILLTNTFVIADSDNGDYDYELSLEMKRQKIQHELMKLEQENMDKREDIVIKKEVPFYCGNCFCFLLLFIFLFLCFCLWFGVVVDCYVYVK